MNEEEIIKKIRLKEKIIIITIILIVLAIDIYVLLSRSDLHDGSCALGGMSRKEKEMHNAIVEKYIGESKLGSDVQTMIDDIIYNNAERAEYASTFISIHNGKKPTNNTIEPTEGKIDTYTGNLSAVCKAANIYEDTQNRR